MKLDSAGRPAGRARCVRTEPVHILIVGHSVLQLIPYLVS